MADYKLCGGTAAFSFRSLEVQTLPIREPGGEHRVQALGLVRDDAVCRACAEKRLREVRHPLKTILKKALPFLLVLLAGAAALLWRKKLGLERALLPMGAAGLFCGIAGILSAALAALRERKEYAALSQPEALEKAAWTALEAALPKKDGENDLSYIPVTEKTLALKNGDLMLVYRLLPAIAVKAWKLLHGEEHGDQA